MPSFAQELVDMFVAHLNDDKLSLSNCALVAKAWLPQSRAKLFRSICLTDDSKFEPFVAFLKDAPHIRPLIKELMLQGKDKASHGGIGWMHIGLKLLADLVTPLVHLQSLTLDTVQFSSDESKPVSSERSVQLDQLVLRRTGAQSDCDDPYDPKPVIEFLGLFSEVTSLDVNKMYIGDDIEEFTTKELTMERMSSLQKPPQLKVQSLNLRRLSQLPPMFWFKYLLHSPSKDALTTLSVHADVIDDITSLGELIRQSGDTLATVALDFTKCVMPGVAASIPKHVSLSCCTSLRSVHITTGGTSMTTSTKLLAELSPSVCEITLELEVLPNSQAWERAFAKLDWKAVEATWLALPILTSVTFVSQRQPETGFTQAQKETVRGTLAGLDQKGILRFSTSGFHSTADDEEDEDEDGVEDEDEGEGEEEEEDESADEDEDEDDEED